jgi:hypothetical protein
MVVETHPRAAAPWDDAEFVIALATDDDRRKIDEFIDDPRSRFVCGTMQPASHRFAHPAGRGPLLVLRTPPDHVVAVAWAEGEPASDSAALSVAIECGYRSAGLVPRLLRKLSMELRGRGIKRLVTTVPLDMGDTAQVFRAAGLTIDSRCGFGGVAELVMHLDPADHGARPAGAEESHAVC